MRDKFRQRNVELAFCQNCGSPLVTAQAYCDKLNDPDFFLPVTGTPTIHTFRRQVDGIFAERDDYTTLFKCLACSTEISTPLSHPSSPNLKDAVAQYYKKIRSPQIVELQFQVFNFAASKYKKSPIVSVRCVDRQGLPYQFKGQSSIDILYGATKDSWFTTRVYWQKFWSKSCTRLGWGAPTFTQRPKIADTVELI